MLFTSPVFITIPSGQDRLFARYKQTMSVSILKFGSTYKAIQFPDDGVCTSADAVYLGGHTYDVSVDEANRLILAGYGEGLGGASDGFGAGGYGEGEYGVGEIQDGFGDGPFGDGSFGD